MYNNPLHSYILTMKFQRKKLRKKSLSNCNKRNEIPRNKLNKGGQDLYTENYKTLLKEIEEDTKK